ncbi:disease resistance protein RPP2A-like isoform X1 [Brassica napus]|uniref:disease resistance protein RPP2A-like isoform X1 n=2 Tax=Brassica napus TaxID=3708 RepID=UPI00207889D5|nr:disease resistance protein RPP2A-like isoform X1 [Brassica napus]XP_048590794.1 disease resistance protein RPP2A-like isoform X1 [Brassica napus]
MDRLRALRRQGLRDFEPSLPPRFMDRILDRMKKSSSRRGISRRRLERCSSSFAEDLSASTSSFATCSMELPDRTSFRLLAGGGDGELDRIYKSLGVSGPDDLAISFDAWEACKTRSSSGIVNRFQPQADVLSSGVDSLDRDDTGGVGRFFKEHASEKASEKEHGEMNLKEVETPFQPKLSEHCVTGSDPILVIYCGDNQVSEEIYLISYIFNELCVRGFAPLRYDIKKSAVTENQKLLHISRVGIIIFSMNFAHSRDCLDGFVAVMDHLKANDLVLIPVFFKVSVSTVRGQSGSFGKAFTRLRNSVKASEVLKWREAMIELTSIIGYAYKKGDEVILAKNIVRDVCLPLSSETNMKLRGTRLSLESILSLLNRSQPSSPQIVGLWGMAGIGKTTITRDFFRTQAERYDVCYFLPDFHLMCQTKGLSYLRDDFFSKIFGAEKVFVDACDTKPSVTRDRFLGKKVLIVLDGVSSAKDAEVLVGGFGWFSGGHTIILTSRNRQVLVQCNAKVIYEIEKLPKLESLHLCCKFASKENCKGRISLTSELVDYASGNPLALRVLGLSIQNQSMKDQKQHLRRLRQHPPVKILDAFKISFNGRDDDEKSIFLDLACFFRGEDRDRVVKILDGCGFSTDLGIYGLIDESLISLVDNKIEMPNIFQDAGRFVVCQEHEEPGNRSRLWDSSDIAGVLKNNTGTEATEGIFLDASGLTFDLSSTAFERMYRLRLLKIHCPTSVNHCKVCLPEGLHSLPDELRLLHWEKYPLGSLPRNFNPKNLVELNMPYSNLTKVWKGTKNLEKLKRIILSHSQQLTKFPRLSKARNLEHIDLEGCTSLVKVNSSILHHHKLTFLSLRNCSRLRVMPTTVHLKSLEVLNLSGCSELENLQDFSLNLKEIYLAGAAIRELPSSIGDLTRLVTLDLENCESLQHLPPGISNLKAMMTLKLSGCSNLKSLPVLDALFLQDSQRSNTRITMEESVSINLHSAIQESSREALEEFLPAFECLSNNGIPQESWTWVTVIPFPSPILHSLASRLYALVSLFLCNAYLVDIPEDICWLASVMRLDLGGNSFSQIPKSIKEFRKLHSLNLRHCKNLKSLPELPRSLVTLNAHGCVSLKSFPTSFEQFPRHFTFSNCFNLSPKVVRKYIGKALDSVKGMAKGILQASQEQEQEHINAPAFSICIPASAGHQSSVNFQAGSSVMIQLAPGMLKTLSGFVLSVVVEFWNNYSNTAGFGIKCICRKSRIDLSPRLERIFHCWAPKEPTTVQRDHMFVFGSVKMHHAEAVNHDFLADSVTFEFHPVNSENQLLGDSCTVKRCGVYLITDATGNTTLSAKRPSSSMDSGGLSSMEHVAPPYKRCRLKGVIEIVILSLRKRKREMSVPTVKSFSKVKSLCRSYVRTGNCAVGPSCSFDHPTWVFTEKSKRLSASKSNQATSGKDAIDTEQEEE